MHKKCGIPVSSCSTSNMLKNHFEVYINLFVWRKRCFQCSRREFQMSAMWAKCWNCQFKGKIWIWGENMAASGNGDDRCVNQPNVHANSSYSYIFCGLLRICELLKNRMSANVQGNRWFRRHTSYWNVWDTSSLSNFWYICDNTLLTKMFVLLFGYIGLAKICSPMVFGNMLIYDIWKIFGSVICEVVRMSTFDF